MKIVLDLTGLAFFFVSDFVLFLVMCIQNSFIPLFILLNSALGVTIVKKFTCNLNNDLLY